MSLPDFEPSLSLCLYAHLSSYVSCKPQQSSQLDYVPNVRSIEHVTQVVIALTSLYHVVTFNQDKVILVCWAASYKHNNGIVSWSV